MRNLSFAVLAFVLVACGEEQGGWTRSSGSVALSTDDALVYALDKDNAFVAVHDADTLEQLARVPVGRWPENIAVGRDDTVYVTNRGERTVSVIRRDEWSAPRKVAVGVEPSGLAVSPDGDTLYVVNAASLDDASVGTLMAIDTRRLEVSWTLPVGAEPRAIALHEGGDRAMVSLFKKGDAAVVDLQERRVLELTRLTPFQRANANRLSQLGIGGTRPPMFFRPRGAGALAIGREGRIAYMTVTWAREAPIAGGSYGGGGPCDVGAIAGPGIVRFLTGGAEPLVDDISGCVPGEMQPSGPPTFLGRPPTSRFEMPIQGLAAVVIDRAESVVYMANRESNNVAFAWTGRRSPEGESVGHLVQVGPGPEGLALSADGRRLYVYSQFSHELQVVESRSTSLVVKESVLVAADNPKIPAAVLAGRRLFFDATDPRMNDPLATGVSCNTCHTEGGREDGHVWGFPDGPRQTPALAGRMIGSTAPYHWSGEFPSLQAFADHTIVVRMGGTGIDPGAVEQLRAYIDWAPAADNPHRLAQPTKAQLRGAQVFQLAGCDGCHGGEAATLNGMADVGTLTSWDRDPTRGVPLTALNVPSLLGLARTAPYLHDGSALTLRDRLTRARETDRHGQTSTLSDAQLADLVEYLKSL